MYTNSEILEKCLTRDKNLYKSIMINITKKNDDDLLQDVYLILLEYDNEKLNDCFKKNIIKYLFATIVRRLFYNSSSKYSIRNRHEKYRDDFDISIIDLYENYNTEIYEKFSEEPTENLQQISENNRLIIIDYVESNFGWYDIELFKMYYKIGDYSRYTGINRDIENEHKETSTFRRMGKRTDINYLSIQASVSKTIKHLKQKFGNSII